MDKYRISLLLTGAGAFSIHMIEVWYGPMGIDLVLLAMLTSMVATFVAAWMSFRKGLWEVGFFMMAAMLTSLALPMTYVVMNMEISSFTKFATYLIWSAIPLVIMVVGLVTNRGDNKN
ncbi:hypothetical protein HYV12_00695 [Candidatus Dojkabacteria bacterium]|nr:hypothetical protein [Candidatus Dojkabacteria bacterium]